MFHLVQRFKVNNTVTATASNVTAKMAKKLGVFDFDHTIVEDNTDIVVRRLLRNEQIPDTTRQLYRSSGWTVYMREIFKLLQKHHIPRSTVRRVIEQLPAVPYIPDLIKTMVDKLNFDVIIISDSNSIFINDWLLANKLDNAIHTVFTNPATYNADGLLEIEMYHVQNTCKLSTVNLCKGMIMEDFVKTQEAIGVSYSRIVYAGDGKNDFCPMLRLKDTDLACARDGYTCAELVTKSLEEHSEQTVKADICVWKTGKDILKMLK